MAVTGEAPVADAVREFDRFVTEHYPRARRLAWRLLNGDDAAVEDVVQNAFLRAYRALPRFRGESRLETWFYRILLRQAANHRRWRAVRSFWDGEATEEPADPGTRQHGDPLAARRIGQALEQLTANQRSAFVLIHLEGYTVSETAELLQKRSGTIKSHLHRALRSLRTNLADLRPEESSP
jgi:RNA polymerase sigma-70 factor (ECF subfamily)